MNERQKWVAIMAKLLAPMEPERAAKALAAMVPMLNGYPDEAFTVASAQAVCSEGRIMHDGSLGPFNRVPTFGELDVALGRWWRKQRERRALEAVPAARESLEPPTYPPNDDAACEAVRAAVGMFVSERSWHREPVSQTGRVKPKHLTRGQLIAAYEAVADKGSTSGDVRLAMLRREQDRLSDE